MMADPQSMAVPSVYLSLSVSLDRLERLLVVVVKVFCLEAYDPELATNSDVVHKLFSALLQEVLSLIK